MKVEAEAQYARLLFNEVSGIDHQLECSVIHPHTVMRYLKCRRFYIVVAVFVAGNLLVLRADAPARDPELLAAELQDTYAAIDSMSFTFSQTTSGPMTGRPKSAKGKGFYARTADGPLMRWKRTCSSEA